MLKIQYRQIKSTVTGLLLLTAAASTNAAILDVSSLEVDYVESNLDFSGLISTGASTSIVPPAMLQMGSYQNPIITFGNSFTGGSFTGNVYSEGVAGTPPPPSATVDTTAGVFTQVDLSSLRLGGNLNLLGTDYSFDTEFWPLTTTPTSSFYDDGTGDFSLSWAFTDSFDIYYENFWGVSQTDTITANFDFTISGAATVVPVPAAIWLFGSGLIALIGFSRRKQ
ncbi:MAG: VPLPA-CTERM sorting domain-containing protein [Gammaproteobacteria bacterium]|nr:VPLPA-CTERM sorting domain-containing protein [Gammaproteobacteria bacterium]